MHNLNINSMLKKVKNKFKYLVLNKTKRFKKYINKILYMYMCKCLSCKSVIISFNVWGYSSSIYI